MHPSIHLLLYVILCYQIYASIVQTEQKTGQKVDLLICCGDFQAVRNQEDLATMNCPDKYLTMVGMYGWMKGVDVCVYVCVCVPTYLCFYPCIQVYSFAGHCIGR